jgi:uncharacterized protein YbdZ (MbtH family)
MASEENDDKTEYLVLINEEEQYSLWPKNTAIPKWLEVGQRVRAGRERQICQRSMDRYPALGP